MTTPPRTPPSDTSSRDRSSIGHSSRSAPRVVRAARGTGRTARNWQTEAALRMLHNNLDPDVAERPQDLVVYGGTGKAARDWASFDAITRCLTTLADDETLLVQSGKPVGVFRTHEWAPRVLIANSNLVGDWANWPEFRRLEALGLTMYGQMTAGSWIYIGTQGILQGTYETFAAIADKRFGGSLAGTLTLTAGLGGMGGAQPLAVTMNGGVALVVDCDPVRAGRRLRDRYLDEIATDIDDAVARVRAARGQRKALSVGLIGNAADVLPELLSRGFDPDIVTDQTSAHDPLSYLPRGVAVEDWSDYAVNKSDEFTDRARESMADHVGAMLGFLDAGAEVFDYGNSLRGEAALGGATGRSTIRGSFPRTSVRCSARARDRSAGLRCPETRPTSRPPIVLSWNCSPRTNLCAAGSRWPVRAWPSKGCPRESAGSATASGTWPDCASTRWWPRANSGRRS